MKTYTFTQDLFANWQNSHGVLCASVVKEWVGVPPSAKKLYISISNRKSKEAYRYRLSGCDYYPEQPDLELETECGWELSMADALEIAAFSDNWPKTGYIKAEYSE